MSETKKNMSNNLLRVHLFILNTTYSQIPSDQMSFFVCRKNKIDKPSASTSLKVTIKRYRKYMFSDQVLSTPLSSIAIEKADEFYRLLMSDTFYTNQNTWKIEHFMKKLKNKDPFFDFHIYKNDKIDIASEII